MGRATLKGILAHKLRLALTALSVVLGVAFVAGTFVLTDTINHTFDRVFEEVTAGVDVTVRARSGFGEGEGTGVDQDRATVPDTLLPTIQAVAGVKDAEGTVEGYAQLVDRRGKAVSTGGAPTLGFNWGQIEELSPLELRRGRAPQDEGEVVIDVVTAEKHDFRLGQRVTVLTRSGSDTFTIVGTTGFGQADNLAGASLTIFDTPTAQRLFGKEGAFDTIDVVAVDGVSVRELRQRLSQALPSEYEVLTGDQIGQESADSIKRGLSFFGPALLTFAGVSLFVGAFIIFNTFSILVAQRTRELALLRALGASRRQVMTSVLVESLVVGLVSSAVGLALGVLVAVGLQGLLKAFGIDLPTTETQFLPRTVVAAFVVGVGVTLVASVGPARRASRVSPMAALREGFSPPSGSLRRRTLGGAVVAGLGLAALAGALFADLDNGLALLALGAALTFIGVAMVSPVFARPLAGAIGAPLGRLGVSGKLGRENAMRSPRRTAATAAALMIGLGLVGCVTVLASSVKESTTEIFDRSLAADFAISTEQFFPTISPSLSAELSRLPEVAAVTGLQQGQWRLRDAGKSLTAADPAALRQVLNVDMQAGDYGALAAGELLVEETAAEEEGWSVGDVLPMTFARTGTKDVRVGGIYARNELLGSYLVSTATFDANYSERLDFVVLVKAAPGTAAGAARAAVDRVASDYPNVTVRDQAETKAQQRQQVNQILGLVSALLGLAILIAFFGIVNTLALSVFERTRELGLLRAVGMARRQVRSMIRTESVITAVLGSMLGLVVGVLFGVMIVRDLSSQGISSLVVPMGQLLAYVVVAALAGVLAAVGPARRAARLDVLAAISHE